MTDVARYEQNNLEVAESALVLWAREAEAAHKIAASLVKTSFVPASMRDKAFEATAAILAGKELGLQPMASLRSINLISGTPALTALAMRGLVQSHGHDVWVEKQTENEAVVAGKRLGSEHEQRSTWRIARAQQLGLTAKDNWKKQPMAMLVARATAEVCRLVASDVLLGMPYAVEELETEEATAPRKTAQRKALPEVHVPAPELEPPEAEVVAVTEPEDNPLAYAELSPDERAES